MPINLQIRDGLMEMVFHGNFTTDDLLAAAQSVREIEEQSEITPDRITDLSDANMMSLDADQLKRYAASRARATLKNKVKSAIVAPKPDQYGLARMFQTFNENPAIEIKLFRDAPAAYAWLGRQPPV